jgi:hypothetical protein
MNIFLLNIVIILAYRAFTMQQPRNKQLYQSHF